MKATEQYFPVVFMLYKVVLTFRSVDEIPKCDHSNESYWPILFCSAVFNAVPGGSNFWVCEWNPKVWPFKWKLSSTFLWHCWFFNFFLSGLSVEYLPNLTFRSSGFKNYKLNVRRISFRAGFRCLMLNLMTKTLETIWSNNYQFF